MSPTVEAWSLEKLVSSTWLAFCHLVNWVPRRRQGIPRRELDQEIVDLV